jgi:murein DD-endopeptidase MepM/ murein hydrolase activator NlpD
MIFGLALAACGGAGCRDFASTVISPKPESEGVNVLTIPAESVGTTHDQSSPSDFSNPNYRLLLAGPSGAGPQPGPDNNVLPIFQPPFTGNFSLQNFFDHDLPFEFPIPKFSGIQSKDNNGYQLTWWGERTTGVDGHFGYDWAMPEGTPLVAVAAGTIVFAKEHRVIFGCPRVAIHEPGRTVTLEHSGIDGTVYRVEYDHLSRIDVSEGRFVKPGDRIGLSGNAGCTTSPHLHLSVYRKVLQRGFVRIDPYGWEGPGPDPWAQHQEGTQSTWLWKDPPPSLRRQYRVPPNTGSLAQGPVVIIAIQWMGWRDDQHPNNEWIELMLDLRSTSLESFDLTGHSLRNNRGDNFQFPAGLMLHKNKPVYVFNGPGEYGDTEIYRGHAVLWDHMGDCARLVKPDGQYMYRLNYSREGWSGGAKSCD